ncbi:MAG: RnfABCDGE type electron transport complex subunit G [Bacteroidales bacterium]|nr:RnfABCDGE type electron transport complex subunit G [Bacteroidales bacterium]
MTKKLESSLVNMFVVLTVITVLSAAALAAMNSATIDPIKKAQQQKTEAAIKMVLPQFASLEEKTVNVDGEELVCNYAYNDSKELVGVAVKSFTNKGFNGYIGVMVGFDDEGTITGYQILETGETPGLGTKADTWFQEGGKGCIIGMNPEKNNMTVTKDGGEVDAITAATISTRAFCDAIDRAYKAFKNGGAE